MGYGNSVTHFLFLNNQFPTLFSTATIKIMSNKKTRSPKGGNRVLRFSIMRNIILLGYIFLYSSQTFLSICSFFKNVSHPVSTTTI